MTWVISSQQLSQQKLLQEESLFFLGNGYLGVRGNFEEGYPLDYTSIRGTYINAYHDITEITYGEKLYGFPEAQQKLVNIMDAQSVTIFLEDEPFSLFDGKILSYQRSLHMDQGYSERIIHWRSPKGKEVKLRFRRMVSFITKEALGIEVQIEPVSYHGEIKIVSTLNGDIENFVDPNDPRLASGHSKRTKVISTNAKDGICTVVNETYESKLQAACAVKHSLTGEYTESHEVTSTSTESVFSLSLSKPVIFTKWAAYCDTLRHGENLEEQATSIVENISDFPAALHAQKQYLADFWKNADIEIGGEAELQEGIRFNLYHLLQSTGRDNYSNIAAKGLSGEGYEGHYFWDTEIYMLPVFLLTKPELAKNLLLYRYHILDGARENARLLGHKKGALFPWRTISGTECSAYFPAGTAQYHISADIAYSYIQYYLVTQDQSFMEQYGAELLFETARLWADLGQFINGKFVIHEVTGPDEYTCMVNNNYYTNTMAKHNLKWAVKIYELLSTNNPSALQRVKEKLELTHEEMVEWQVAANLMYLPYDQEKDINPQDDSFMEKAVWDFEGTPKDHYPLLLNYHPLTLYRYQVCKQADTVLAHFLLEDEQSDHTIKNSYDYYETITTHDSSLSHCVFSIMASKVGYADKAYQYFIETARLDLDNTHGNTKDGLHMANMGGTWMAIVYGFAGLRVKEQGLELSPTLPKQWTNYRFTINYQNRHIAVEVNKDGIHLDLISGEDLNLKVHGETIHLSQSTLVTV